MTIFISINGHVIPLGQTAISPFDRGLTLGDGLFETIKLVGRTPWYLSRHLARLEHAAHYLGIPYPEHIQQWIDAAITTSPELPESTLALRVTLTRGISHIPGLAGSEDTLPTTLITIAQMPPLPVRIDETGLSACIASAPRNERAFAVGIKTTSYIEPILALREAKRAGYDEAIFLDSRGFVSEASASNIFVWISDVLVTPPLDCGILPGVTRAVVLELARQRNLPTAERAFTPQDLANAQEAFCTNALRGIVPLTHVDGNPIHDGRPGTRTAQLTDEYVAVSTRNPAIN